MAPLIGEMNLYKVFIVFDIGMLLLSGILMYFLIRKGKENRLSFALAIGVTILYVLGYPLNSVLSGYSYLTIGIIVISTILLVMRYFENNSLQTGTSIIYIGLLCMQIFFSYYLFVPVVYGAIGIFYLRYFQKKHQALWNRRNDFICCNNTDSS